MKKSKALILALCAIVVMVGSVLGTLAFLTDRDTVVNTFTVGNVDITVDEADVDLNGEPTGGSRVKENKYHLIPGSTYIKDPTMTVKSGSEEAYVRMLVKINCMAELDAIFAPQGADLLSIFNGHDAATWLYEGVKRDAASNTVTYEFRYKEPVVPGSTDVALDALFESITVPGFVSGEDLETVKDLEISVVGHAIQKANLADEDAAWAAFDNQMQ